MQPVQLPILDNWQDHQYLAQRLYEIEFPDYIVEPFGRNGQAQGGIDVLIRSHDSKRIIGVQCRRVDKLDLAKSYQHCLTCPVPLTEFWMFTSLPTDKNMQTEAVDLTKKGPIPCVIKAWDDIERSVQRHETLLREFYPSFGWAKGITANAVVVHLNMPPQSYMELMIVCIPEEVEHYGGKLWVSDLQDRGRGTSTSIGNLTFRLEEVFGTYEAFYIQSWLNGFSDHKELLSLAVGNKAVKTIASYWDQWQEHMAQRRQVSEDDEDE
jgi:hypothetical protein